MNPPPSSDSPEPLVLEWPPCLRAVAHTEVGLGPVLEVALVERVKRSPAHPRLPESEDDDVTKARVLVFSR